MYQTTPTLNRNFLAIILEVNFGRINELLLALPKTEIELKTSMRY